MNQNPEQLARDQIDTALLRCGWLIQDKAKINLNAGLGVAVREYQTDICPADYVLFEEEQAVRIIEAKRAYEGIRPTVHDQQSSAYANAKLKYSSTKNLPLFPKVGATIPALVILLSLYLSIVDKSANKY